MQVYFDVSCLNRPFDDQRQERIRLESEAVLLIMERIDQGDWEQVSSEIAEREVDAITNIDRRNRIQLLLPPRQDSIRLTRTVKSRGDDLVSLGLHPADALHVAAAEAGGAEILLTCDDRLLRWGRRHRDEIEIEIANPLEWLGSMTNDTDT